MTFTYIFLFLLILSTLTEVYLSIRQNASALSNQNVVPSDFKKIVKPKDHKKAALYTSAKAKINILGFIVQGVFLYILTLGGLINFINDLALQFFDNEIVESKDNDVEVTKISSEE